MTAWLRSLGDAVRFLTLVPVPGPGSHDASDGLSLFPLVGLLIGAASAVVGLGAYHLFGAPLHVVAVVAATSIITAGVHLDGLADTCDAVFSWRSRERKLEIMTDSRIGAMGAIALVLVIAFKIAALLALGEYWWLGALFCPVFGRWADLYGIASFPAAKAEGLASSVRAGAPSGHLLQATGLTVVLTAPLWFFGEWIPLFAALVAAVLAVHALAAAVVRSLGGLTGDVYGALSEIGEVLALLALCAALT